jgi:hypothetical protein
MRGGEICRAFHFALDNRAGQWYIDNWIIDSSIIV